jgi:spore coat polysaccharide biosynthesis protein SpsF
MINHFPKIDVIVEARTNSRRLPGKVLKKVCNKTLLELTIERLKRIKKVRHIIIATTKLKTDNKIVAIAKKLKIKFFRGSSNDVLERVLHAAKKFKTDIIVEITADTPLIDPEISDSIINFFLKNFPKFDYVSNDLGIHNKKYKMFSPIGLSTKVFTTKLLSKINKMTSNPVDREHVVNYIVKNPRKFKLYNFKFSKKFARPDLRFTLDYNEDLVVIKKIYQEYYYKNPFFDCNDIINFLDKNPKIRNLNKHCIQLSHNY